MGPGWRGRVSPWKPQPLGDCRVRTAHHRESHGKRLTHHLIRLQAGTDARPTRLFISLRVGRRSMHDCQLRINFLLPSWEEEKIINGQQIIYLPRNLPLKRGGKRQA